ncbi:Ig-like domain-containing protein, partial [Pseudomonas sp. TH31]|uniref:Ig-like domain-containing protein n=1 Tax=Pseudomonas sp. TH31 TaxID=2796396 RepID=UPI001A45D121
MNTKPVNVAVVDGKTITEATELQVAHSGKPVRIKAITNGKYILAEGDKGVAPENITIKRVGKDLHVALEGTDPDQPQLIIEGFFDSQGQLVGVAEDGAYYEYISSDAEQDHSAAFLIDGVSSPQVLGSEQLVGFGNGLVAGGGIGWFWPAVLGLAGVGLLGAAYAVARDDKDNDNNDSGGGSGEGPETPSLDDVNDNVGDKTGRIENGGVTDDSTPTFSGEGTPGNTIIISDGDKVIGEVVVGDDGKWEFTPETPLSEGAHEIIVVEKDPEGNESKPSEGFELIVDLTAPGKSIIRDAQDNVGDEQGTVGQNGVTDDNTPTLKGTAEPGSTVEVFANGKKIGEAPVNADGSWSFTPNPALADDKYTFTTVAVDAAGNRGLESDPYVLTIDTGDVVAEISITGATDNEGPVQEPLRSGDVTDDTTPTLNGLTTPYSTVTIYNNGLPIGTTKSDASGNWSFTPELKDGHHRLTATVMDGDGVESDPSAVFELEIDTIRPGKPGEGANGGIDNVHDDVGFPQGSIPDGGSTDDSTPTLSGGGQTPGDKVAIYNQDGFLGEVEVKADGSWSFTPNPPLKDGSHDFTMIVSDPAGNASEESDPYTVIIDTQEPDKPAITSVIDDQGDVTGPIVGVGGLTPVTDDAQPDFHGTAEPGSTVIIYDRGVEIGRAPVDANGDWTFEPRLPLSNDSHEITVAAMDDAGNIGEKSDPFNFDVLAGGAPAAPAITGIIDNVGTVENVMPGGVTNDPRPTIHGTGEPGSTITIYADGVPWGTTVVGPDGLWSKELDADLPGGLNNITATATNGAGNVSPETGDYPITLDITPPASSTGQLLFDDVGVPGPINDGDTTDDNTPTFSGTAEPGSWVIILDQGAEIGRERVNPDGSWSFTPRTPLIDGDYSFSTIVEDAAGNQSAESPATDFTVDTSAVVISITHATDNEGTIQDPLRSGDVTDDTTPTLIGQATPGATVTIYDSLSQPIGTVTAGANGRWSFDIPTLGDGPHSFTATATPTSGVESPPTTPFTLEIDTIRPGKPGEGANGGIDNVHDDVGFPQGSIPDGGSTDDSTPTLSGGGQTPGDKVAIYDNRNSNPIGIVTVRDDGTWSFTPSPLNDGVHDFTMIVTDPAGNASEESDPYRVIIDTDEPDKPAITSVIDDQGDVTGQIVGVGGLTPVTDDAQPDFHGTAEPGSTVIIYDRGVEIGRAPVDANGDWTFKPRLPLSNDSHEITVAAMDDAGNIGEKSDPFNFDVLAGGAPAAPAITGIIDNVGTVENVMPGGVTNDPRPTIHGTGEPGSTITIYADGVPWGTTVVGPDGLWSKELDADLPGGLNNITATATNGAGNVSPETGDYPITLDITPPASSTGQLLFDDVGVPGPINDGDTTDDNTPTFSGTAEPGSWVIILDQGAEIGRERVNPDGSWSFTPRTPLIDGDYSFSTIVEDAAGNQSAESPATDFTVDTSAVVISITHATDNEGTIQDPLRSGDVTDDTTPTLIGQATPGATVTIYDSLSQPIGTVTAGANGRWSFDIPTLGDGPHSFTATATPTSGVESPPTTPFTLEIDTIRPGKPGEGANGGIDNVHDDVGFPQGSIPDGGSTDDSTPTLSGGGQTPGDKVAIYNQDGFLGEVEVKADGSWSFTPSPLNDGVHDFTMIVTDPAGNASEESDPYRVIIDTVAPAAQAV